MRCKTEQEGSGRLPDLRESGEPSGYWSPFRKEPPPVREPRPRDK